MERNARAAAAAAAAGGGVNGNNKTVCRQHWKDHISSAERLSVGGLWRARFPPSHGPKNVITWAEFWERRWQSLCSTQDNKHNRHFLRGLQFPFPPCEPRSPSSRFPLSSCWQHEHAQD